MSDQIPLFPMEQIRIEYATSNPDAWDEHLSEYALAVFDKALAAHDAEVRADERKKIAEAIFDDEQRVNRTLNDDPTNSHFNGVLRGLQRARDIAAARGEEQ